MPRRGTLPRDVDVTIEEGRTVIVLKEKGTELIVGTISEAQLQFLVGQFEEETDTDQDYWINRAMVDLLRERGDEPDLVDMIESAMGERDEIEVVWSEE